MATDSVIAGKHMAQAMTRSFACDLGLTKLLVTPGGGKRAGMVNADGSRLLVDRDSMINCEQISDAIRRYYSKDVGGANVSVSLDPNNKNTNDDLEYRQIKPTEDSRDHVIGTGDGTYRNL